MKNKLLVAFIAIATFATITSTVKAQLTCSIEIKDQNGNPISGNVPINTAAYAYGHYEDLDGTLSAQATIDVYYDDGTGFKYQTTIFTGTVQDGQTIHSTPYTMTKLGTYQFRFTCKASTTTGMLQCGESTQARTTIQLVIPEPGTMATLAMAFLAFGLLAHKKKHTK